MDAKAKADFINSVGNKQGNTIPCPKCNYSNREQAKFCAACGTQLIVSKESNQEYEKETVQVFNPVVRKKAQKIEPKKVVLPPMTMKVEEEEEKSVFAEGLPEWSIEPPQIVVRRKRN